MTERAWTRTSKISARLRMTLTEIDLVEWAPHGDALFATESL